ncbi:hypothetical protein JCM3770_003948 [Rhodotorula araucariae]
MDKANLTAKRHSYASRACVNCRRRKSRCSGTQPCETCQHHKDECTFTSERDGRKATSAAYVSALELRIAQLEAAQNGGSPVSVAVALPLQPAAAVDQLEQRNRALQARVLILERALSTRGVSISQVLEEEGVAPLPHAAPVVQDVSSGVSKTIALPTQITQGPSALGKRPSGRNDDERPEDHELSWVEGMKTLQLSEGARALLFHGPSSTLAHSADAEAPAFHSFGPISASVDYAPSPLTPASPRPNPLSFHFLDAAAAPIDLDWARNLPQDLGIDRETHDAVLDLFEAFFAPWCAVVDMPAFRRDMRVCLDASGAATPTRTDFYSPMLHNSILALGCFLHKGDRVKAFPPVNLAAASLRLYPHGPSTFFAEQADPTQLPAADLASVAFYNHARAMVELECERPMLSTVRALLFIASFNSAFARLNLGYLYFGIALRCAASLGVFISSQMLVARGVITDKVRDARDRVYWTTMVQDSLWSLASGRFLTMPIEEQDIALPAVDEAADAAPWLLPPSWSAGEGIAPRDKTTKRLVPNASMPSYTSSCFLATAKLAAIQSELISKVYAAKDSLDSAALLDVVTQLDVQLEAWSAELPIALAVGQYLASPPPPHVITLQLSREKTAMLLHRPFFHRPHEPGAEASIRKCTSSAHRVMQLLDLYDGLYGLCYAPLTSIQTCFVAGTVHLLAARRSMRAAKRLKASLDGAEDCCAALLKMSATWSWAARTHRILRSLVRKWSAAGGNAATSPAHASDKSISPPAAAAPFLPPLAPPTFDAPAPLDPLGGSVAPAQGATTPAYHPFYFLQSTTEETLPSAEAHPHGSGDLDFTFAAMTGWADPAVGGASAGPADGFDLFGGAGETAWLAELGRVGGGEEGAAAGTGNGLDGFLF